MLTSAVQCNQDQFYLLIATAVGGSIFLVKTGSVLSINQHIFRRSIFMRCLRLRMTRFDNYNIFNYYHMQNDVVYIIRVLYNKVDWQSLFSR